MLRERFLEGLFLGEAKIATYVLVHGAFHRGELLADVAAPIRAAGHEVHTPTLAGNRPGDLKTTGLEEAVQSLIDYIEAHRLSDIVMMGHSYGGMPITIAADRLGTRVRRLVYWNAVVPLDGECVYDMVPPDSVTFFEEMARERGDGSIVMPYPIWRDVFMNDADADLARHAYGLLNPHPAQTYRDPARLTRFHELPIGKSYINCQQDAVMPHSLPWHPRLSEKLGLFRLVEMPGGHEVCFTNPSLLAEKIIEAGRD